MKKNSQPGQLLVAAYGAVSLLGTLLLMLPWATVQPGTTSLLQAWFTSMSALTVTGLVVVNTGEHWTMFGQTVILLLIQVGGLGLMVLTTIFLMVFGLKVHLGYKVLAAQDQNYYSFAGINRLVLNIVLLTLTIELVGAVLLLFSFPDLWSHGIGKGIFYAIFHAVSAFNGAGIDITGASLLPYRDLPGINIITMALILLGSLGYVVLQEFRNLSYRRRRLSLHSRLVLLVTGAITLFGSCFYFLTEYTGTLAGLPLGQKIVDSLFQAVTRTAGFTTIPVLSWNEAFQFLMILMMFVGASPGSVGGGIKTTTFGTIMLAVWAIARGKKEVVVFEREIAKESVLKAFTVTIMALLLTTTVTLIIMAVEQLPFMPILFEVVSALATVGLSMGITDQLSPFGLVLISICMFIGRIGVLSLVIFLTKKDKNNFRYLKEDILIG
ncbi:MAG: potassium transporter TrkG [Desulfitobacteriaceae bacterium]|nr:potassium transporter TrkG [Desulfitobacteriaceae bacterium]MDD4752909.1 potassium transporter TrkG [Desulfitobacteriaceae bacterium]